MKFSIKDFFSKCGQIWLSYIGFVWAKYLYNASKILNDVRVVFNLSANLLFPSHDWMYYESSKYKTENHFISLLYFWWEIAKYLKLGFDTKYLI